VHALNRPDLKDPVYVGVTPPALSVDDDERVDLFAVLRERDVLVHHPYESFAASVEEFVRVAASDPSVLAIKVTLYRTSGDSPIVRSLIRAAERGKQVAVLVELKARGDEQANIEWARALEEAGVHVVYGLVGLKTHTKTALVVRDDPDGIRRYVHIGTGNYNSTTAKLYDDLGLFTTDEQFGADLTHLFNYLTGYGRNVRYEKLLVAPHSLRNAMKELVLNEARAETAKPGSGRIRAKMNSLVDPDMIEALYTASRAGVPIDLVVRGICCLRPGVAGMSENIRVRSIVGRYLEHSRIYEFANGEGDGRAMSYIGSADWMPRNLDRRIEAIAPVCDPALQNRLREILEVDLADNSLAWTLGPDGTWTKVPREPDEPIVDTHVRLQELASARRGK
jgi:polyphosphate kinase